MNIRFYNARILTMADGLDIIENGELHVSGDRITYVGDSEEAAIENALQTDKENVLQADKEKWDREIDVRGNLLMPGFKNAHTHSAMTFLRSHADDMKLQDWLTKAVFPYEAKLRDEDFYYCALLAVLEYLTSGITSVCDMYLNNAMVSKAMADSGMRSVHCGAVFGGEETAESLREDFTSMNQPDSLISFVLGFHAEYSCSKELLGRIAELANELKQPIFTHCSETSREVEECRVRYGMSPVEYLDSIGMFNYGGTLFHGVHVSDNDIEIIKKRGISIVTNPASNLKLASGIAPITRYMQEGINIGIGTDGPASNNCLDMFREMFLVTGLGKYRESDASAVDAVEVLKMAVKGGAVAMGRGDCDSLKAGKKADIIMLDLYAPNMQPIHNIAKNIVYSGSKTNVKMTMINGNILYENGEFNIGISPDEIYKNVAKSCDRIFAE
ncbi:5-methylthioadenosine/S-adenosylhomocysteine deaminase [Lachnospiraceae bacterium NE2001]|nr:5-methylthioadenosine/S-adenosylhomocysteine deaminase [Lachnospiraceae bacterium NE2001]